MSRLPAPNSWLEFPGQFGFSPTPQWKPTEKPVTPVELTAAKDQHAFAKAVRDYMAHNGITQADLAAQAGVHPETVGTYLRGEATIPYVVMARMAKAVGLTLTLTIEPIPDKTTPPETGTT